MLTEEAYPIYFWDSPTAAEVDETLEEFLEQLEGPTWMYFLGEDSSRCRVVTTLLHGNEPSGLHAIHNWILSGDTPATDLYCFIGSVEAAKRPPGFHYRMLPDKRDLNRCFRPPFNDAEGLVAADLLRRICAVRPESVIDIHNTSGAGPAFAIAVNQEQTHFSVCSLFTSRLIIADIKLGAIMEFDEENIPITTIECGGAHDPKAHELACAGFNRFAKTPDLFNPRTPKSDIDLYQRPVRVELIEGAELGFSNEPIEGADLTLHSDVERYNFGLVPEGELLGWLGLRGLHGLVARDSHGADLLHQYFIADDNELRAQQALRLFMVTKNVAIAKSDCLFYVVPVSDNT